MTLEKYLIIIYQGVTANGCRL